MNKLVRAFLLALTFVGFTSLPVIGEPVGGILVREHYIDVPFHYQVKNYYCGPAALQMLFDFYGENISQYEIADVARTVPYVTYTDELRRAAHFSNMSTSMGSEMSENITGYTARKLGYAAFEKRGMTLDDLKNLIDRGFPIILLMRWVPGKEYGHYRVAVGYNETHVFLHDPWNNIEWGGDYGGPNLAMNYTFFCDMWSYSGNWSLFVSPWRVIIDMPREVYVGQLFTVTANITYICPSPFSSYEYPASSCIATIILPEGLTLADGENATKNLGSLKAGDTAQAFWTLTAKHSGNYSLAVEAEGKTSGFVSEKPNVGPSYDYQDRIGGYASSSVTVVQRGCILRVNIPLSSSFCWVKVDSDNRSGSQVMFRLSKGEHVIQVPTQFYVGETRYLFSQWSDGSTVNPRLMVLTGDLNLTAWYIVQVLVRGDTCYSTINGSGWVKKGERVTISINATIVDHGNSTRHVFSGWFMNNSLVSQQPIVSFVATEPVHLVAGWDTEYQVQVKTEMGTTSGEGWAKVGTNVTVSVSPTVITKDFFTNYVFKGWKVGDTILSTSPSYSFKVTGPILLVASWKEEPNLVTISATVAGMIVLITIVALFVLRRSKIHKD